MVSNHSIHGKLFADSLQDHLEDWRDDVDGSRVKWWNHWVDGIHSEYRTLAQEMVQTDAVKLHQHIAHLRSSQAFAFNLFLPFREGSRSKLSSRLSDLLGVPVSIEEVRFEWVPPGEILGEIRGDRPSPREPATAVDVVLWCRVEDGAKAIVLFEVKLSEPNFTYCNGRTSTANDRTDVCESARVFFEDPRACYLRRPSRSWRDRRYWKIFAESYGSVHEPSQVLTSAGPVRSPMICSSRCGISPLPRG